MISTLAAVGAGSPKAKTAPTFSGGEGFTNTED